MSKDKVPRFYARKFLVDSLQLRFAGHAAIHFAVMVMVFVGALFAPAIIKMQSGEITDPYVQSAAREFLILHNNVWIPLAGALTLVILHNILLTHRIAGPLYRFRPYLEAVGNGDLSSAIRFRKKDHLHKEAEVASRMVEALREKIVRLERDFEEVNGTWNELRSTLATGKTDELRNRIRAMSIQLEGCRTSLSVFKTSGEDHSAEKCDAGSPTEDPALLNV